MENIKRSAYQKSSSKPVVKGLITLILIIAATWYIKQGQNNPFRALEVINIKSIANLIAIEKYDKKGTVKENKSLILLSEDSFTKSNEKNNLSEFHLIWPFYNVQPSFAVKNSFPKIMFLSKQKKLMLNDSLKKLNFSEAINSYGYTFRNIFIENDTLPIALSIKSKEVSFLFLFSTESITIKKLEALKEKSMIVVIFNQKPSAATDIRNTFRPEFLLNIKGTGESKENIIVINDYSKFKVSKNIKGMVSIR